MNKRCCGDVLVRTDVEIGLCASFYPCGVEFLRHLLPLVRGHLPAIGSNISGSRMIEYEDTTDLDFKSTFEPTTTQGISVTPQNATILSYTICIISNEALDVTE